ncbi:MAG: chemotaxis-specific protein-glutamate methyltransferase CheB [Clostridiales bacterium]|nr:chemotaxis-specific protein-glutamate methyltransferase CheB [Clostridiales bacterium]
MKKILVIDDSALMRKVISDIIEPDDRFHVEDTARNGVEGLQLLMQKKYDAVLLDINMPKMGGIELLEELHRRQMQEKVIVVSTLVKDGTSITIRALELGAFDFITKPLKYKEFADPEYKKRLLDILVSATEADSEKNHADRRKPVLQGNAPKPVKASKADTDFIKPVERKRIKGKKLVALACSTGGPRALQSILPKLSGELDAPVLIVQHMPVGFTKSLAVRMNEFCSLHVKEAEDGEPIKKGNIYIAKGGSQMRYEHPDRISIKTGEIRNGLRPCADIMYESLCLSDYDEIICVVLTGMGQDGTRGIQELSKSHNVYVIAQDEETSTVYGMPRVVYEAGLTDEVVPLESIADAVMKKTGVLKHGR